MWGRLVPRSDALQLLLGNMRRAPRVFVAHMTLLVLLWDLLTAGDVKRKEEVSFMLVALGPLKSPD